MFIRLLLKKRYKFIGIDLRKQQALEANLRTIQQINFTKDLDRAGETRMFFIPEEATKKKLILDFSQGTINMLKNNLISSKMTQYNSFNVKLSNAQLNKSKLAIKNKTEVMLRLSSNMTCNSNDETNFRLKLLLTNRQVADLC